MSAPGQRNLQFELDSGAEILIPAPTKELVLELEAIPAPAFTVQNLGKVIAWIEQCLAIVFRTATMRSVPARVARSFSAENPETLSAGDLNYVEASKIIAAVIYEANGRDAREGLLVMAASQLAAGSEVQAIFGTRSLAQLKQLFPV